MSNYYRSIKILEKERNVITLKEPLAIIGDLHGQFYDLLNILDKIGEVEDSKYLFLGNYINRGYFSVEVLLLLYSIKINYPKSVILLRGNHECRKMSNYFNFHDEVLFKYDQEIFDKFMESFDFLPLSCVVNGKYLAVHGGISPALRSPDDVNNINRFKEIPKTGIFTDIVWADPIESQDGELKGLSCFNDIRTCSIFYGIEVVNNFL